jgi:hypothetical protein
VQRSRDQDGKIRRLFPKNFDGMGNNVRDFSTDWILAGLPSSINISVEKSDLYDAWGINGEPRRFVKCATGSDIGDQAVPQLLDLFGG